MIGAMFAGFIVLFVIFAVSMERRLDRIAIAIESAIAALAKARGEA